MTPLFAFTVLGPPIPKGRPRVVKRGRFVHTYTPDRTVAFEDRVAVAAREAAGELIASGPIDRPLACAVRLYFPKPKRKAMHMDRRPDAENVVKAIWDGMERGGVVKDDARFVQLYTVKLYDVTPRVEVAVVDVGLHSERTVAALLMGWGDAA